MPDIPDLNPGEGDMDAGEFNDEMSKAEEQAIDEMVDESIDNAMKNLPTDMPEATKAEFKAKLDELSVKLKSDFKAKAREKSQARLSDEPSDIQKRLSKAESQSVQGSEMTDLTNETVNDAVRDADGDPNKLTQDNIDQIGEKNLEQHLDNVDESINEAIEDQAEQQFDKEAENLKLDPNSPEVQEIRKDTASAASESLQKPQEVTDLSNKINDDSGGSGDSGGKEDPNVKEGKNWKEVVGKVLGTTLKIAGVVAAIMLLTSGGRNILNKAASGVGDAVAAGIKTIANFAAHAFAPLIGAVKNILHALGKYVWIIIAIVGIMVLLWIIKIWRSFSGGGGGGGTEKIELVSSAASPVKK